MSISLKKHLFFFFALLVLVSCKSKQNLSSNGSLNSKSVNELLVKHKKSEFDFNTLQSKLKMNYTDGKKSFSPSVSLRLQKDEKIWMSVKVLGITMAKALITPTEVSFYEKLNRRYYQGDFKAISNFLGADVNFEQLQNLIIGQSIFDNNSNKFTAEIKSDQIFIRPKQAKKVSVLMGLYANNLKASLLNVDDSEKEQSLNVKYKTYQEVDGQNFPLEIQVNSQQKSKFKKVDVTFKSVTLNQNLSFPFSIPSGYKRINF